MDRKKFPAELATHFLQNKVDLFNEWLSCGGSWEKVSLRYERKVEDSKKFKRARKGTKARDIIATYGEETLGVSISKNLFQTSALSLEMLFLMVWISQTLHFVLYFFSHPQERKSLDGSPEG